MTPIPSPPHWRRQQPATTARGSSRRLGARGDSAEEEEMDRRAEEFLSVFRHRLRLNALMNGKLVNKRLTSCCHIVFLVTILSRRFKDAERTCL